MALFIAYSLRSWLSWLIHIAYSLRIAFFNLLTWLVACLLIPCPVLARCCERHKRRQQPTLFFLLVVLILQHQASTPFTMTFQATFTIRCPQVIDMLIKNHVINDETFEAYIRTLVVPDPSPIDAFINEFIEATGDTDNHVVDAESIRTYSAEASGSKRPSKHADVIDAVKRVFPNVVYDKRTKWVFNDENEWNALVGTGTPVLDQAVVNHVFSGIRFKDGRPSLLSVASPKKKSDDSSSRPKKRKRTAVPTTQEPSTTVAPADFLDLDRILEDVSVPVPVQSIPQLVHQRPTVGGKGPTRTVPQQARPTVGGKKFISLSAQLGGGDEDDAESSSSEE
jgi:hypothetical protein